MKKLLFSLLLLLCTTVGMAQGYRLAGDLETLQRLISQDNSARIKLTADIDISSLDQPLCDTFRGIIDGSYSVQIGDSLVEANYKLYAGTNTVEMVKNKEGKEVPKITSRTRASIPCLFSHMEDATLNCVDFYNIQVEHEYMSEIGVIAQTAKGCTFTNVHMDYCSVFVNEDRGGTLLGYAEDCTFYLVRTTLCDVKVDGVEAGGLVGHSKDCTYNMCFVSWDSSVFADGTNVGLDHSAVGWCGGFVGYSEFDTFNGGINGALVGADESQVGGYAGESVNSFFNGCINLGIIVHLDEDDFEDLRDDRNKKLAELELSANEFGWLVGGTVGGGLVAGTIVSFMLSQTVNYFIGATITGDLMTGTLLGDWGFLPVLEWEWFGLDFDLATFLPFCAYAAIIVAVIVVAIQIGVAIYNGDDETGGIVGLARGGSFEQCQNYGQIKCRDDNCGGIVGLGLGVTINNCYNGGAFEYDEDDTTGSILGRADVNKDDNNKKCKITNCLSTEAFHIVGDWGIGEGIDPASGNNYRAVGGPGAHVDYELEVNDKLLNEGHVAYWLNQGIENRSKGVKPWRQNLFPRDTVDLAPVLIPNHDEVTIYTMRPWTIRNKEDLILWAEMVEKNPFEFAVLDSDIDMTGEDWTPICQEGTFRGFFDGQGHTINGLKCSSSEPVGLFGNVSAGVEIRNVIIGEDCEFTCTGDYHEGVAGIVGKVDVGWKWGNVFIENCANYGKINAPSTANAGGILGLVNNNTDDNVHIFVNNCYNMGTITAGNQNGALLCGYMRNSGVVSNCWSGGKLKTSTSQYPFDATNPRSEQELLVGFWEKCDITNCYTIDAVTNVDQWQSYYRQFGVTDLSSSVSASGELTYKLNGETNNVSQSLVWQQSLGEDATPMFGIKGVYHKRTVNESANGYGTACLPYAVQSDDDISYYTFSEVTDSNGDVKLYFNYTEDVPAGKPVLFRVQNAGDYEILGAGDQFVQYPSSNSTSGDWTLNGTFNQLNYTGTSANYIYYVSGGEIRNATSVTIAPYRAYFNGPSIDELLSNNTQARISLVIDGIEDETTALQLIADDVVAGDQSAKAYTLFGTEASEDYRGLMIRNGKKVMMR